MLLHKNKLYNKGFTLAEVLITLGIIGVVAAITIPILIVNYQKQQYVVKFKKAFSMLNQAFIQMASDNGCTGDLKCTELFSTTSSDLALGTEVIKYIKVAKNCGVNTAGCWDAEESTTYDGTSRDASNVDDMNYNFITTDGITVKLHNYMDNCTSSGSTGITRNMTQVCGRVFIDVNSSAQGPNNFGRDIYMFWITNGSGPLLYPAGGIDDNYNGGYWNGTAKSCYPSNTDGTRCAGRIAEEGEMNY